MASSGRIKGITIEIGGDTTELQSALKDVDKSLRDTQSNLRDINKLLKLDPTNTELLTQKQKNLKQAVSDTKDRLQTLKDAQSQVGEGTKEWDALQREIIDTEQKLKQAEKALKEFGSVGAQQLQAVGQKVKDVGNKMSDIGGQLTTKVTLPLAAVGAAGVKSFAEVDKTMQLTNSTMGNTEAEAKLLSDAMKAAAAQSVFGMNDAATATLNFARAGLDAEQAAAALAPAMNLAAGEGGNLDTVSGGLVATINGFHGSFDEAGHYADVFAAACNNSALDVDSLSNAMSVAAPIFSAAGYAVEDAALYMGVMANNGIEADKAANSLKTGFARLISPAKEGATAMDGLGFSITNADGTMKDCVQIQAELHDKFAELSEAEQIAAASAIFGKNQMAPWLALINTAPGDVQALSNDLDGASLSIDDLSNKLSASGLSLDEMRANMEQLGVSSSDFDDILKFTKGDAELFAFALGEAVDPGYNMDDVVNALGGDLGVLQNAMDNTRGTTEMMADAMMSGFGGSLESLKSSIDVAVTSIGEALAPSIQSVASAIQDAVTWFNSLSTSQQETIVKVGALVAAIGPLLAIGGKVTTGIGSVIVSAGKVSGAISAAGGLVPALSALVTAAGPFLVGGAIVAGVIAAGVAIYTHWDEIKAKAQELFNKISETWTSIKSTISTKWSEVKADTSSKWAAIKSDTQSKMESMKSNFTSTLESLRSSASSKWESIKSTVSNGVSALKNMMNFSWSLPHLSLPHFTISGEFSLNPPSVPSLGVSWYKKAYENGVLFKQPTVLQTPYGMKGFGDGNGAEVVLGLNKLREIAGSGRSIVNNFTIYATNRQDENELADIIIRRITAVEQRAAIGAI